MKAVIHVNNAGHQKTHAAAMKAGLEKHGINVQLAGRDDPQPCDFAVIWGWRQRRVIQQSKSVLVMERGHVQPRMEWTSCGWNGLGRRASYPVIDDAGARWKQHFAHHLMPWGGGEDYALVCGQVPGDMAIWGVNFEEWAKKVTERLVLQGSKVVYRPHPLTGRHGNSWRPEGAFLSTKGLAEDFAGASVVVTFNSTVGVEATLAGVPTVACDEGSMAWSVASHDVDAPRVWPDRTEWCSRLAWTQWTLEEIAAGDAWDALKTCMGERDD